MPILPETESALLELSASQQYMHGVHEGSEPVVSVHGRNIGEIPYDPVKHQNVSPNPISIWSMVTGEPYVKLNIPSHPLNANIVVHQPEAESQDKEFGYGESRNWLIRAAAQAIEESMPGMTDHTFIYSLGAEAENVGDLDAEVITTDGNPEEEAEIIADICKNGLTFVISDFLRLPIKDLDASNFPETVAIKANVPTDMAINKAAGLVMRSGVGIGEVDTADNGSVQSNDEILARHDRRIKEGLKSKGIMVASVVLDREVSKSFYSGAFDTELALAIRGLTSQ